MAYVNFFFIFNFNTPIYKTDVPFHSSHLHFDRESKRDRHTGEYAWCSGARMDTKTRQIKKNTKKKATCDYNKKQLLYGVVLKGDLDNALYHHPNCFHCGVCISV